MNIGNTIRIARRYKGLSQQTFAGLCDITQTYLSKIENNVKEPTLTLLRKIAQVLNLPLPIFFLYAMDNDDIPQRKQDAYNILMPGIHKLIQNILESNELSNERSEISGL